MAEIRDRDRAMKIIENNLYLTLATASRAGEPWVTPLYYVYDGNYNFYWYSAREAKHSRLIAENPQAAVTVFDSSAALGAGDGVYFQGQARAVTTSELPWAMMYYAKRVARHLGKNRFSLGRVKDFLGRSPVRMYKFVPKRAWVLGPEKKYRGKYVDSRVRIRLS